jgi:hypothetical protein
MAKGTLTRSEALSEAMRLLDPENTLTPGGPERRVVTETTLQWIDEMGPEKALYSGYSETDRWRQRPMSQALVSTHCARMDAGRCRRRPSSNTLSSWCSNARLQTTDQAVLQRPAEDLVIAHTIEASSARSATALTVRAGRSLLAQERACRSLSLTLFRQIFP